MPASQAENANMSMGIRVGDGVWVVTGQVDRARYMASIMLSKHRRAETKWVR